MSSGPRFEHTLQKAPPNDSVSKYIVFYCILTNKFSIYRISLPLCVSTILILFIYMLLHTHTQMHVTYRHLHECGCMYVCLAICMCLCLFVCILLHIQHFHMHKDIFMNVGRYKKESVDALIRIATNLVMLIESITLYCNGCQHANASIYIGKYIHDQIDIKEVIPIQLSK